MKDEELAEQFATKECCATCHNINHSCKEKCECWTFAKKGFLVGIRAGRLKYHDLRKNPDDLPNENMKQFIVMDWRANYLMGWYCIRRKTWYDNECPNGYDDKIEDVVKWKEIE